MNAQAIHFELDRWGKRVFLVSLVLLLGLEAYVWIQEGSFSVPVGFAREVSPVASASSPDSSLRPQRRLDSPLAVVAGATVCAVDERGRAVALQHLSGSVDLPVITGLDVDDQARLRPALAALEHLRGAHYALYGRLSELHWDPKKGWTAYLIDLALPVRIGSDSLKTRLCRLAEVFRTIEMREDLNRIEELDMRFAMQVIVRYRDNG